MRQAGIIAAPGVVALKTMVGRLKEDHDNAAYLGAEMKKMGFKLLFPVKTNMVFIDPSSVGWSGNKWVEVCAQYGFKTSARRPGRVRLVTHYGIEKEDLERLVEGISTHL